MAYWPTSHFNMEVAAIVAASNAKVSPEFTIETVLTGGNNVTATIAPQNGMFGYQVVVEIKRIHHDPDSLKVKVVQPFLTDMIVQLKENLEIFEQLIEEGNMDGPMIGMQFNML